MPCYTANRDAKNCIAHGSGCSSSRGWLTAPKDWLSRCRMLKCRPGQIYRTPESPVALVKGVRGQYISAWLSRVDSKRSI